MTTISAVRFALILLFWASLGSSWTNILMAHDKRGLEVEAAIVGSGVSEELRLVLTNRTAETMSFSAVEVPWRNPNILTLVIVDPSRSWRKGIRGPDYLPLVGLPDGTVDMEPGMSIEGPFPISFSALFIDYAKLREEPDLLLFWSFVIRGERVGGMVVFPPASVTEKKPQTVETSR